MYYVIMYLKILVLRMPLYRPDLLTGWLTNWSIFFACLFAYLLTNLLIYLLTVLYSCREARIGRHFSIHKTYHGCPQDFGWFVVVDTTSTQPCRWERRTPFPQFLYSKHGRINNWNDMSKMHCVNERHFFK